MKKLLNKKEFLSTEFMDLIKSIILSNHSVRKISCLNLSNKEISKKDHDVTQQNIPERLFKYKEIEYFKINFIKNIENRINFRRSMTLIFRVNHLEKLLSISEVTIDYHLPNGNEKKFHSKHLSTKPEWHNFFHVEETCWTDEKSSTSVIKYYDDNYSGEYLSHIINMSEKNTKVKVKAAGNNFEEDSKNYYFFDFEHEPGPFYKLEFNSKFHTGTIKQQYPDKKFSLKLTNSINQTYPQKIYIRNNTFNDEDEESLAKEKSKTSYQA